MTYIFVIIHVGWINNLPSLIAYKENIKKIPLSLVINMVVIYIYSLWKSR